VTGDPHIDSSNASRSVADAGVADAGEQSVRIELSDAQVDQIIRAAADTGSMALLLTGLGGSREDLEKAQRQVGDTEANLSSSLLSGLLVLAAFPADGSSLGNAEVARMMGMNPSTAHRYITTLVVAGLLERDPGTRRYRLSR
jgi:Fic family protein